MRGAQALHLPVVVTEQYPSALGHTVVELRGAQPDKALVVSKTAFTMLGLPPSPPSVPLCAPAASWAPGPGPYQDTCWQKA